MKKLIWLLSITLALTTSKSISQPRQNVSEKVCLEINDLKAIVYNNEKGNKAQAQVPLLKSKILILDSTVNILHSRISGKDAIINSYAEKEQAYISIIDNHKQIELNQTSSISVLTNQLKQANKEVTKQKVKKVIFSLILGGLGYGVGRLL